MQLVLGVQVDLQVLTRHDSWAGNSTVTGMHELVHESHKRISRGKVTVSLIALADLLCYHTRTGYCFFSIKSIRILS